MDFSQIHIQFSEKFLPKLERKIAERPSSYSNTTLSEGQLSRKCFGGKHALILIFLSTLKPFWETDTLIRSLAQKAFQCSYQGIWKEVQDYLEHYQPTPQWFIERYLQDHPPEEFFGNFLPRSEKEIDRIKYKPYFPSRNDLPRVRKTQRRRGYDDKGTLRLPHENHGEPPRSSNKEDRRGLCNHPLLRDLARREQWDGFSSPKGGYSYEQSSGRRK